MVFNVISFVFGLWYSNIQSIGPPTQLPQSYPHGTLWFKTQMVKNPYGLRNNDPADWVSVYEVEKHDADEYFCADCGTKFIPVQPAAPRKQWFFRHEALGNCQGTRETAIHLMAKQILVEDRKIMLPYLMMKPEPEVYIEYKWHKEVKLYRLGERKLFNFDAVQDEMWQDGKTPDIVAVSGERKLFVEIVVTHDIGEEKLNWIRELNVSTLRVSLSGLPYESTKDNVRRCLMTGWLNGINIMQWVHHAKKQDHQKRANEFYIQQVIEMGLGPKAVGKNEMPDQNKTKTPQQGNLFP